MNNSKLNRRNFLKASAVGVSVLAAAENIFPGELTALPSSISERQIIPLNQGWLFSEKFTLEATKPNFNDKSFKLVNLPHTNKMLPMNGFDEQEYTFVSIYRNRFKLPPNVGNRRVFIDFGGVMTAAQVYLNGNLIGENKGGYNDFSFELTKSLNKTGENVLAVEVDSTERKDIPPFGNLIDYLTFGGIYREVQLRIVNETFIENAFAKPVEVLSNDRKVNVKVYLQGEQKGLKLLAELLDGNKVIATKTENVSAKTSEISLINLQSIELWDINKPKLYDVRVTLSQGSNLIDHYETRIGFREAKFTENGFFLNGKVLKLRGSVRQKSVV